MYQQQLSVIPHGNVVVDSVDLKGDVFIRTKITIPLQEGAVGLGRPVTVEAAERMINTYADTLTNETENIAIELGKETLLYLLSQKGCESLCFYFCINQDKEKSIIAMPVDANGNKIILHGKVASEDGVMQEGKTAEAQTKAVAGKEVGGGHSVTTWRQLQASGGLYIK